MILHQNPLRTVAELHRSAALDVDMQQSNRYCIRLNTPNGKEGYYLASPIYNAYSRKLVRRLFLQSGFEFRFCGSNCSVTVTGTQISLRQEDRSLTLTTKSDAGGISRRTRSGCPEPRPCNRPTARETDKGSWRTDVHADRTGPARHPDRRQNPPSDPARILAVAGLHGRAVCQARPRKLRGQETVPNGGECRDRDGHSGNRGVAVADIQ